MNCLTCKYADWLRTRYGKLHPSGNGRCGWKAQDISLPIAFYYVGRRDMHKIPTPDGGHINRKRLEHCPAYEPKE